MTGKKRVLVTSGKTHYGNNTISDLLMTNSNHQLFVDWPEKFEMVLFTGGADVNPEVYGDKSPKGCCKYDEQLDLSEAAIFKTALENEIKMVGICRGAQFITAMCGGKIMHHIESHDGAWHQTICAEDQSAMIRVNSIHHQMCLPGKHGHIIAWSKLRHSNIYIGNNDEKVSYAGPEVEAVLFPEFRAFGVQWHPETMQREAPGWRWFHGAVKDMLDMPINDFTDKYRGMKNVFSAGDVSA